MLTKTFGEAVKFLSQHTPVVVLDSQQPSVVAVTPAWQGRVMTSTLDGSGGESLGFINETFIASSQRNTAFDNYGGEDRLWLGPEAGQFGLFHAPGDPFDVAHWRTPAGLQNTPFAVTSQGHGSVAMAARFDLENHSGTTFACAVRRQIDVLSSDQVAETLGVPLPTKLACVAFASTNTLANVGSKPWRRETGLLSIWSLGQFSPLPRGFAIVPFDPGEGLGPMPVGDYFGPIPPERFVLRKDHMLFRVDGKFRSKLGVPPRRARNVLGSFDPDTNRLTMVQFNLPPAPASMPWVNSLWQRQANPYAGDVVNSYNDGGAEGAPNYELESSSPAAELAPEQAITHVHRTFHFQGTFEQIGAFAKSVLGVDIKTVPA